ncbi:nucleoporin 88 [Rhipicephalus microplus]|uniref:nucleoporin 88 n=1 Tax=Rhipicephalus microplus TaxID=6941 RepID=UPI001887604A|nr:nucleoporin 88-like [Rhipicephalus microplus]
MAAASASADESSSFLHKLLLHGDKYCSSIHTRMLIAAYDDYIVAWSQNQLRLFAVSAKTFSSAGEPDNCIELVLSNPPAYDVDNVLVSCAKHLLLSGPRGITVVSLPKTPATLLNERKALCKSWTLGEHFFLCHKSVSLVDIAWHPDSESGLHVLALTSDNNLRLYDILEPQSAQLVLPVGVNHNLSGTLSASVGDAAVSFDFGDFPAEGEARQVFVLGGSGDIYLTHVSPQDDNRSHLRPVFGPLSMQPQAEDNYGVDGFSIICLPGAVPVLAVATTGGTLYHCLALGTQNFSNGTREECEDVSLYVFEKIRLDLAFSLSTSEEEMFSCPIRLHKDPTNHQRYICVHNAGVHAVVVPFIDHLQAFAEDDTGMQMMSQLHTEMSIVESLLCTRALASSKPAPPVGVVVLPEHPGPLLIVLTASWKIVTMMLMQGYQTYLPALLSQSQQDTPLLSQGTGSSNNLVAHVKQLLEGRSLPTLSQAAEDCTPQQSLELLLTATQRIREQWFQKLEACQLLIARRVQAAHDQRDLQLEKLSGLLEELALLQQRDRELKARYEALYSTQQKLVKRVEDVLHQLQRQVPVLSAAEQAMTGELKSTEEDLKVLKESLEQAQAKLRYQQQSHKDQEASRSASQLQENLTPNQVEQIAKALKEEGDMISELVQRVTALMD